jgi:hypothetical protein
MISSTLGRRCAARPFCASERQAEIGARADAEAAVMAIDFKNCLRVFCCGIIDPSVCRIT